MESKTSVGPEQQIDRILHTQQMAKTMHSISMSHIFGYLSESVKMIQKVFLEPYEKIVWSGVQVAHADNEETYVTLDGMIKIDPTDEALVQNFSISVPINIAVSDDQSELFEYFIAEKQIMDKMDQENFDRGMLH